MPGRRAPLRGICWIGAGLCVLAVAPLVWPQKQDLQPAPIVFRNRAPGSGIGFQIENHPTERKHLVETMPGGVAAFDYDGDGLPDLFFANGAALPSLKKAGPKYWNRLYRNQGNWQFEDVTEKAGVQGAGYSMGAAVADYDNDGHIDLFVPGVNRNLLYRNRGDGTFEDVTRKAGIKDETWSVAAAWFDFDNDGLLDLLVVNYLKWSPQFDRFCGDATAGIRVYCHPRLFEGLPNTLYRNRGDGTFEDVSANSEIGKHIGKGMSAGINDADGDGFLDVYVANDHLPNFLFRNRGDGTFEEVALLSGAALLDHGKPVSSMGVDFRDYDNDGAPDILVTALSGETYPLFRNEGGGNFRDATFASRLAVLSHPISGWGVGLFDFNHDGWKDIFAANSHVNDRVEHFEATRYRLPNSVFAGSPPGQFVDLSAGAGAGFQKPAAHRGSAFADFNSDGRMDVAVSALQEPVELWENASPGNRAWIILKLTGTRSNRDGIGARVRIGNQANIMTTAVGYASSSHAGVHFGLGNIKRIPQIEIRWPSGALQVLKDIQPNQVLRVTEPEGPQ